MNAYTYVLTLTGIYGCDTERYAKIVAYTYKKMQLLEAIWESKPGENFRVDKVRKNLCVFTKDEAEAAFRREAKRLVSEMVHLHTVLKNVSDVDPLLTRYYKRDGNGHFLAQDGIDLYKEMREELDFELFEK